MPQAPRDLHQRLRGSSGGSHCQVVGEGTWADTGDTHTRVPDVHPLSTRFPHAASGFSEICSAQRVPRGRVPAARPPRCAALPQGFCLALISPCPSPDPTLAARSHQGTGAPMTELPPMGGRLVQGLMPKHPSSRAFSALGGHCWPKLAWRWQEPPLRSAPPLPGLPCLCSKAGSR